MLSFLDFHFHFDFSFWSISTIGLSGLFLYFITHPAKFEKFVALLSKWARFIWQGFDYTYIKFDLQGKINDYLSKATKKIKGLGFEKVKIAWTDPKQDPKTFMDNGQLIIRLRKGDSQNENIVNASMAFISHGFLRKAKYYIAKYQRESLDIYVCYDLLKNEKREILDQFVQDFMKEKMEKDKIADFFEKYMNIDDIGVFYPIFVQELTFLGEKVFGKKKYPEKIHTEVSSLVNYLNQYSQRKLNENIITEFNGEHCKFALRIIGKNVTIRKQGAMVYIRNLLNISSQIETIYLLSSRKNKGFVKNVYKKCKEKLQFEFFNEENYKANLKNKEGESFEINAYMLVLRNKKIEVFHSA